MTVRQAKPCEAAILTDIAAESEAYWGYDENFMNSYKTIYRVTEKFINSNPSFVIEDEGVIIGFYCIIEDKCEAELEYFYIKPEKIGKGYGKILWRHLDQYCREHHITKVNLVTSPQAADFYIKMGASLTGEVDSLVIKDRKIPKLTYTL